MKANVKPVPFNSKTDEPVSLNLSISAHLHGHDDDEEHQDNGPHQTAEDAHKVVALLSPKWWQVVMEWVDT